MVKKKVPATRWHDGGTPIEELPADGVIELVTIEGLT